MSRWLKKSISHKQFLGLQAAVGIVLDVLSGINFYVGQSGAGLIYGLFGSGLLVGCLFMIQSGKGEKKDEVQKTE